MIHKPYQQLFGHLADFDVTYQLFSPEEGGRKQPAFQGILWHFIYDDFPKEGGYIIYPEILDPKKRSRSLHILQSQSMASPLCGYLALFYGLFIGSVLASVHAGILWKAQEEWVYVR